MKDLWSASELAPEAVATLPPRRSPTVIFVAGNAAWVLVVAVYCLAFAAFPEIDMFATPRGRALEAAVSLAPWVLGAHVMRRLDVRRVPWFYLCLALGPITSGWLAWRLVTRYLSLPYRDWPVEYWHAHRVRMLPRRQAYVLVAEGEAARRPRGKWDTVGEPTLQVLWAVLVPASLALYIGRGDLPDWFRHATMLGVAATAVAPLVLDVATNFRYRRTGDGHPPEQVPESASATGTGT